jgi:hypothetical protein
MPGNNALERQEAIIILIDVQFIYLWLGFYISFTCTSPTLLAPSRRCNKIDSVKLLFRTSSLHHLQSSKLLLSHPNDDPQ